MKNFFTVLAFWVTTMASFGSLAQTPDINVKYSSFTIPNNNSPSPTYGTSFGLVALSNGMLNTDLTVENRGTGTLTISSIEISGTGASDFTVSNSPSTTLAPNATTTLRITFNPSVADRRLATVTIISNDPDESPFRINLLGTGMQPEIDVLGNGYPIANGSLTPITNNHTHFGAVFVTAGSIARTFTIDNNDLATLNLTGTPKVAISGSHASDFSLTSAPAATVARYESTTFQITFNPSGNGVRTALLTIANDDEDENSYTFAIEGVGTAPSSSADYTISTANNTVTITDVGGNGETMEVGQSSSNVRFFVSGRTYSIDGGAVTPFSTPADIALASKTGIVINTNAGHDIINVGTFTSSLPSLTINGGVGDDIVNMNGDITFTANAHLDLDLQNDDASPGRDVVNIATDANVALTGTGNATIKVSQNVFVNTGGGLTTANGNLVVEANQQSTPTSGNFAGVRLNGLNALFQVTGSGLLTVKGKGGNTGNDTQGIYLRSNAKILGGTNTVTLEGIGGPTSGFRSYGVNVLENSEVRSTDGNIVMNGTGDGTGFNSMGIGLGYYGVFVRGTIAAGGSGNITITGRGSLNYTEEGSGGVYISTGTVTTAGGNILFNGYGGGSGSSTRCLGVVVSSYSSVSPGGMGTLTIYGEGGSGTGTGNYGVGIACAITSNGGNIIVTGKEGGGNYSHGVIVDNTDINNLNGEIKTATNGGDITVTTNSFASALDNQALITGHPSNKITFLPLTNGTEINFVSTTEVASSPILISDFEFDNITGGAFYFGNTNTGAINVNEAISHAAGNIYLTTGQALNLNQSFGAGTGNITINAAGGINPKSTTVDLSGNAISFTSGNNLNIAIGGTTVNTGYDQLNIQGAIDLTGLNLVLSGSYVPVGGETFTIVSNDGTDAIVGKFNNLDQGATIPNFRGSGLNATISYTGGSDNNDVVITVASAAVAEINLQGGSPLANIPDGDTAPTTAKGTDFGNVNVSSNGVKTFTIQNTGTIPLNVSSIGSSSGLFVVGGLTLPATIAANSSATFTVTFSPTATGSQNATITVNNDDGDEAVYDFVVTGTGMGITPTLGTYPATSVVAGQNAAITPSAVPTNATSIVAYTNNNVKTPFTGLLVVNPTTGVLTVTKALQAGVYAVTVKAFNGAASTTTTFTLTVTNPTFSQGAFSGTTDVSVGNNPISVAVGDFNGDGKQDIATANYSSSNTVSIRLGDGAGGFSGTTYVSVGGEPNSVAVGDFNGDGKQDIAVVNSGLGVNTVSIRLGDGAGGFSGTTNVSVGTGPRRVAIGDFNGDGKQDLAVANNSSVSIRLGDGLGGFSGTTNVSVGTGPRSVAIGDFNGDGKQDIAVSNYGSNGSSVSIRLGDGLGGFSGTTDVSVGTQPLSVAVGDFNGDGKQDIAVANYSSSTVSIRLGDGMGGFSGTTDVSVGSNPISVAVGDFNGDGRQDIASANYGAGGHSVSIRLGVVAEINLQGGVNPTTCGGTGSISFTSTNIAEGSQTLTYKKNTVAATTTVTVAANGSFTLSGLGAGVYSDFAIGATTATGSRSLNLPASCSFVTTWKTDNAGTSNSTSITIPTTGTGYNYDVDWNNDGTFDEFGLTGNVTHNYGTAGTYTVAIRGDFPRIYFNAEGDRLKLLSIGQWGSIAWQSMGNAFQGCENMVLNATDVPNTAAVTDMSRMFAGCSSFNQALPEGFNTSAVTTMRGMFSRCISYNRTLPNSFNTERVTDMSGMFDNCSAYNQALPNSFNTERVTDMSGMFAGCSAYDKALPNSFNTSAVTNMRAMFSFCSAYNKALPSSFNTARVTDMSSMFFDCRSYNQPLPENFTTAAVTNMGAMFFGCSSYNQALPSNFTTAAVTDMNSMFAGCTVFNQASPSSFNVSAVTDMDGMFMLARAFDQSLAAWGPQLNANVNLANMLSYCGMSVANYDATLTGFNTGTVTGRSLGADELKYCASATARTNLMNVKNWTISGDALLCPTATLTLGTATDPTTCGGTGSILFTSTNIAAGSQTLTYKKNAVAATTTVTVAANGSFTLSGLGAGVYSDFAIGATTATGSRSLNLPASCSFVTTWKTDNVGTSNSTSITVPTTGTGYNYDVDWNNDGTFDEFGLTGNVTHNYGTAGTYTVAIRGDFPRIYFNSEGDRLKLLSIDQWGSIAWASMNRAFRGCANMVLNATDVPNLGAVTDMSFMFYGCSSFDQALPEGFNTSAATNMSSMFAYCSLYNQALPSTFNTSMVVDMSGMFRDCRAYNKELPSSFNTQRVTNMSEMFYGCVLYNKALPNDFTTSLVTNMNAMFYGCSSFNQLLLSSFNTERVTSMELMFQGCSKYNQVLPNSFNTAAVTNMFGMFSGCSIYNQALPSSFTTSLVTNMSYMFYDCIAFNQNLGSLNLGEVTNMTGMLTNSGLSVSNYDATLIGWNNGGYTNKSLGDASPLKYCAGQTARTSLITKGWTITGDASASPATPTASVTVQPTCTISKGTIVVTAPSGTGIEYSIGGPYQISGTFSGLNPGPYTVTAKNTATGCISSGLSLTVNAAPNAPATPTASVTVQPTCTISKGTIEVTAPSGTGIEYSIGGPYQTLGTFSGLNPGPYTVTAKNTTTGCISPGLSLTVNAAPNAPATPTASVTVQPTCTISTGTIEVTAPSGTGIEYSIGGPYQTSGMFSGLNPGPYTVTAKNTTTGCISSGLSLTVNAVPSAPATPTASVTVQPTCTTSTGTIVVTAPSGTGIEYSIGGLYQSLGTFSGLTSGPYTVTAKNTTTGCISSGLSLTVNAAPNAPATPTASVTVQPTCTISTGTIEVTAPSGTGIEYSIGGLYQTSGTFSGLNPGPYTVTAKNTTTGCISSGLSLTVNSVPSALNIMTGTSSPICAGATSFTIPYTVVTGTPTTYSVSGAGITTVSNGVLTNPIVVNLSGPASANAISYTLTVGNASGCVSGNITGSVTVVGPPTISLTTLQQTLNEGNNPVFCDTDANPVNSLQFNVSGLCVSGSPVWRVQVGSGAWSAWSATAPVSQPSNNQPHRYQAACDANCASTYSGVIELTINNRASIPQNVSLLVDGVTVAVGESKEVCSLVTIPLTFNANCATGEVILYSVDGGEYSSGVPTGLVDNQFHNYRVRCRKSDGTPSCVESESGVMRLKLVTIPSAPTVSLSSTSSCDATASFSGQSTCGSLRTVWYNATTNVALPSLPSTVPSQTTSYYARCQTENGCVSEKSNVVTFTLTPTQVAPVITASQEIVCTGTTVTISANCPAGSQTFWNTGVTTPSFQVAFNNVTKQTYWAKCLFEGGCQSAESVRKDIYWNAFVVTLINVGETKSGVKPANDKSLWSSQFVTRDGGPELEQSTQQNPTLYFVENANKIAPRYWTINVEACGLSTDGSLTFDMLATPEMGVIRSFNTHENNAPYFMYANREGWTELYAQNHPAYGFYQDNGAGGNVYDAGLPKGLYKLGIRYWDMKGWGSIYPATRQPQGNVLAYQEYWFRIQSKDGVGVGAARTAGEQGETNLSSPRDLKSTDNVFAQVMPNPVTNVLRLKVQNSKEQVVQTTLTDATGREVMRRKFVPETNSHQEEFEVSELPKGMYFLKVSTSEKQTTLKVVKVD